MKAEIEMERQHLKRLENQRDIEAIEAKLKVYAAEESKRKARRWHSCTQRGCGSKSMSS